MNTLKYNPKKYKELVSRLLDENHKICTTEGLPNTFFNATHGVDVLSNFDNVFNSFVTEFPLAHLISNEQLVFTFKVLLQQQLDSYWYAGYKRYKTNIEIYNDESLIYFPDKEPLFSYLELEPGKEQVSGFKRLALRLTNSPLKNSSGMFLPYAPVPMYNFLNKLCRDLDTPLVVTNTLRSIEYQDQLRRIGHITPNESSHLYGYTVDIERKWYEDNDIELYEKIKRHLDNLENRGQLCVIDYGQIWHICLSPCFLSQYLD